MIEDIYDPLEEYKTTFEPRFKDVCEQTLSELAAEAKIDLVANRETCRKIYATEEILSSIKKRLGWWKFLCWVLWIVLIVGGIILYQKWEMSELWVKIVACVALVAAACFLFIKVHPRIKALKHEKNDTQTTIDNLKSDAWTQMEPLNRLFDWDILARMMTRTVPRLEFDPYFTTQRLADLEHVYGWDGSFNEERSVLYSHSGQINGNPFVLCRTRKMEWGEKTYYGSLTIHWTTYERNSDGSTRSVNHTETLHAEYTAPFPNYYEKTRLIYGNTAAPDLIFHREQNGLAGKEGSLRYKWNRRQLRKKAEDLKNSDFAMMTNEEFEVAFDTRDRNNNHQHALLFTPLAQQSMMALLTDKEIGYGDDFDFNKEKMINVVIANHMQNLNLDMNPNQFHHFDYDKAVENFRTTNLNYFRAIYFNLAPLLCVPMYQQIRPEQDIYGRDMKLSSTFWEHESLANFLGQQNFMHPDCVTDCIIKTDQQYNRDNSTTINVHAHGYRAEARVEYIPKRGGDGYMHDVPVEWYEYLPVCGNGQILMKEDNDVESLKTNVDHVNHIYDVLQRDKFDYYRRRIASKIVN